MHTIADGEDIPILLEYESSQWGLPHLPHHHLTVKHGMRRKWLLAGYIIFYCVEDPFETWPVRPVAENSRYCAVGPHSHPACFVFTLSS